MKPEQYGHSVVPQDLFCTPLDLRESSWPTYRQSQEPLRLVDLFCGCGGLTLGVMQACVLENRRLSVELALDNNSHALRVYEQNFGRLGANVQSRDIIEMVDLGSLKPTPTAKERKSLTDVARPDILVAGPPCQGHSDLNNASRRSDPRNFLYLAPARAAASLKPKVLLIENVPTVTKSTEDVVSLSRQLLQSMGYHVAEVTLTLTQIGVPQSRTRHIQIASMRSVSSVVDRLNRLPARVPGCYEYISDIVDEGCEGAERAFARTTRLSAENAKRIDYLFRKELHDLPNNLRPPCHRDGGHSYVSMYGRLHHNRPAQTITSGFGSMGQGRFVHPTRPRMITAHEAARLQAFPDYFEFPGLGVTALREMIGNAVPPTLAKTIVKLLMDDGHLESPNAN